MSWWYTAVFSVFFLLSLPYYFYRMWRRGGYRARFGERLTWYRPDVLAAFPNAAGRIWLHAVSVGELEVALGLMDALRRRLPDARFLLTTTTSTARAIADTRIRPPDLVLYFPVDLPWLQRRLIARARPRMLALIECELWPHLIQEVRRAGVPLFLVNGRLSEKSYRGYRWLRPLLKSLWPAFRGLWVQTERDAARFRALGAPASLIRVLGSAKYRTAADPDAARARARQALRAAGFSPDDRWWIAASTWPGEEAAALKVHREVRKTHPNLKLLIAPRHVERTGEVLKEIRTHGFHAIRRSETCQAARVSDAAGPPADVFLLDTTGELKDFYTIAEIVFVGKSLTAHGGQNPIEPAAVGCAVLTGPHMENFPVVFEEMRAANAIVVVETVEAWTRQLVRLLDDETGRKALGARALALVQQKSGALERTADAILLELTQSRTAP